MPKRARSRERVIVELTAVQPAVSFRKLGLVISFVVASGTTIRKFAFGMVYPIELIILKSAINGSVRALELILKL